jgi:D-inositol-3-phosphate glycosyltransferase
MADLFVMPTREFEMFCMAAVEAQACGKPVVASDHGGLMEVVPEECGIRFPVGDAKSLERHLEDLLERPERAAELGRRAVVNASRYSWERVCAQAEEIYRTASP